MSEQPAAPAPSVNIEQTKPQRPGLPLVVLGTLIAAVCAFLVLPRLFNAIGYVNGVNSFLRNEAEKQLAAMAEAGIGIMWGVFAIFGLLLVIAGFVWNSIAARNAR